MRRARSSTWKTTGNEELRGFASRRFQAELGALECTQLLAQSGPQLMGDGGIGRAEAVQARALMA